MAFSFLIRVIVAITSQNKEMSSVVNTKSKSGSNRRRQDGSRHKKDQIKLEESKPFSLCFGLQTKFAS